MSNSENEFQSKPYVSHEQHTRSDIKIKKLLKKFGQSGYGIFWSLIEEISICESTGWKLYFDASTLEVLADEFYCSEDELNSVIDWATNLKPEPLLILEDNYLYSNSLIKRMEFARNASLKRKISASNAGKASAEAKKKEKENKEIQNEKPQSIPAPTLEDLVKYLKSDKVTEIDPQGYLLKENKHLKYFNYYSQNNWLNGKDEPITNWIPHFDNWVHKEIEWFKSRNKNGSKSEDIDTSYLREVKTN